VASGAIRPSAYGGQAVIEGVMMRGREAYSIAVRKPDRTIVVETWRLGRTYRSGWGRVPLLRGFLMLWQALVLGVRALSYSASQQAGTEAARIEEGSLTLTLVGSLVVGTTGFVLLPAGAAHLLQSLFETSPLATNVLEGCIRLGLLVGYIAAIGRVPEIARVFGYHAAEHMTIHAFEAGGPLTVDRVNAHPKEHPRCGTAFLLTVVVLSILLFTLLGPMSFGARIATRLAALPGLAALAYEYLRITARISTTPLGRVLVAPNLALQKLTTRRPTPDMVEVAIRSFEALREREAGLGTPLGGAQPTAAISVSGSIAGR
jgi:uncharacterized protein YqhQ